MIGFSTHSRNQDEYRCFAFITRPLYSATLHVPAAARRLVLTLALLSSSQELCSSSASEDDWNADNNWLSEKLLLSNARGSSYKLAYSSLSHKCFVNILRSIFLVCGLIQWTLVSLLIRLAIACDLKRLCTMVMCLYTDLVIKYKHYLLVDDQNTYEK